VFASDSVPSNTSTDVDDYSWSAIDALTSLHVPVKSSLTVYQDVSDEQWSLFMVPTRHKGQRPILFGRVESKLITHESSESDDESPQFSHYEPNVLKIMENMGYDLTNGPGLIFDNGRRTLLQSFVSKGKAPDYYHRTRRGWAMCQLQSRRLLSLKSRYIIIARQACHRRSQMSVSTTSSKNFR